VNCGPGDQCTDDVCNEDTNACEVVPKALSTSCNDGDACTGPDHCNGAGECVALPLCECGCTGGVCHSCCTADATTSPPICCQDSDCGTGEVCDNEEGGPGGQCVCDASKCYEPGTGQDTGCVLACDCPEKCENGTCNAALQCTPCSDVPCATGTSCDGVNCVPDGICNSNKNDLCDDAFEMITGSGANPSKCCPDSSGCVKITLELGSNSVCSTSCGTSCLGVRNENGHDAYEVPIVQCAFGVSDDTADLGLAQCYNDIVNPINGYGAGGAGCAGDNLVCCIATPATPSDTVCGF
jgi:hypothetical protein